MRPRSIEIFGAVYLTYGLIMLAHGILMGDIAYQALGDTSPFITLGIRFGSLAILGLAIVFRASRIAKWIAVAQVVIWLYRLPQALGGIAEGNIRAIVWSIGMVLGLSAVALLFTPESRDFFSGKGRSAKADAAAFE